VEPGDQRADNVVLSRNSLRGANALFSITVDGFDRTQSVVLVTKTYVRHSTRWRPCSG